MLLASCVSFCKLPNFSGLQFLLNLVGCNKDLVTLQHLDGLERQAVTEKCSGSEDHEYAQSSK